MCNATGKAVILLMAAMLLDVVIGGAAGKRYRRIVGGDDVGPDEVPKYVVRLKIYNKEGTELRCGGTIVSPRHILTAGHCLEGRDNVTVYSGTREPDDSKAVLSNYSRLIPHPDYNDTGKMTVENDVGIVVLDRDLDLLDGRHTKLALASKPPPKDGTNVTFFGWGLVSDVGFEKPKLLKTASLVMASAQCEFPTPQAFCTNTADASPCGGDSGSPIVYSGEVIGLHSSDSCKGGKVARHISVYHYRDWINSVISE